MTRLSQAKQYTIMRCGHEEGPGSSQDSDKKLRSSYLELLTSRSLPKPAPKPAPKFMIIHYPAAEHQAGHASISSHGSTFSGQGCCCDICCIQQIFCSYTNGLIAFVMLAGQCYWWCWSGEPQLLDKLMCWAALAEPDCSVPLCGFSAAAMLL